MKKSICGCTTISLSCSAVTICGSSEKLKRYRTGAKADSCLWPQTKANAMSREAILKKNVLKWIDTALLLHIEDKTLQIKTEKFSLNLQRRSLYGGHFWKKKSDIHLNLDNRIFGDFWWFSHLKFCGQKKLKITVDKKLIIYNHVIEYISILEIPSSARQHYLQLLDW